jgi:hypothetical protein
MKYVSKYSQNLSLTEPGCNGNTSLAEKFDSPEDPNFKCMYYKEPAYSGNKSGDK